MIYIIRQRGTDVVKIGFCKDANKGVFERLKSIKTGNPYQLDIEWVFKGTKIKERCLHFFCISRHIDTKIGFRHVTASLKCQLFTH